MRRASPRNQRGRDRHLGGAIASEIRWGFGKVPTIQNVEILRVADQFSSPATAALLQNFSNPTILEGKTRPWRSVLDEIVALPPSRPSLSTFETMARAFDANVAPLARQSSTRVQLWKHWRGILTMAVARVKT